MASAGRDDSLNYRTLLPIGLYELMGSGLAYEAWLL